MTTSLSSAGAVAAATPEGRDRYVDFLRLFSIAVVVLGHWTLTLLVLWGDGGLSFDLPAQIATWGLMVMALFFAVGGFSHAKALTSLARRGGSYGDFLRARTTRLLQPVLLLLAVWVVISGVMEAAGWQKTRPMQLAADRITTPLWFIGVYLVVVLLAPPMYALHRRFGFWVLVAMAALVVLGDLARLRFGLDWAGVVNLVLVWMAIHQLGFVWSDGLLTRRFVPLLMFVGGWGVAAALTFPPGGYSIDMVGLPDTPGGNFAPPNVPLLAHAIGLVGLALLLRGPMSRWLARPRPWLVVALGNAMVMTIFCWHLTAIYLVQGGLLLFGLEPPAAPTTAFWWFLPLWYLLGAIPLVGLVQVFKRAEQPTPHRTGAAGNLAGTLLAVIAVAVAATAIFELSQVGLDGLLSGSTEELSGYLSLPAWPGLLALVLALLVLRFGDRPRTAAELPPKRETPADA